MGSTYSSHSSTIPAFNLPYEVVSLILDYASVSLKIAHMCREALDMPHIVNLPYECLTCDTPPKRRYLNIPLRLSRELLTTYRPIPAPHGIIYGWESVNLVEIRRHYLNMIRWVERIYVDISATSGNIYGMRILGDPTLSHLVSDHVLDEVNVEAEAEVRGNPIDLGQIRALKCNIHIGEPVEVILPPGASLRVDRGSDYVIVPMDDDLAATLTTPSGEQLLVRDGMLPLEMEAEAV